MKPKLSLIVAFALALLVQTGGASASDARNKALHPKKAAAKRSNSGAMPCQTTAIDAREDREIIILKLVQRLDCLENKVNFLSEQVSVQSHGVVKPFVEKSKEFVIKYPRDPEEPQ